MESKVRDIFNPIAEIKDSQAKLVNAVNDQNKNSF